MRAKHIITLIIVIALIALVAILFATLFSVRAVYLCCYDKEGNLIAVTQDYDISSEILDEYEGQSILTLSKDDVLSWVNSNYPDMYAMAVVKEFPNTLSVYMVVECEAVYSIESDANTLYLNSFGYVIDGTDVEYPVLDISDAFDTPVLVGNVGELLQFDNDIDNARLQLLLDAVDTVWQLCYDYCDIAWLIDSVVFNSDNSIMTVNLESGAKILVYEPSSDLSTRLINAFSVYANTEYNLQIDGAVITVSSNGSITTSTD